jgi:hypothetical protein
VHLLWLWHRVLMQKVAKELLGMLSWASKLSHLNHCYKS